MLEMVPSSCGASVSAEVAASVRASAGGQSALLARRVHRAGQAEELVGIHLECVGEPRDKVPARIAFSALDPAKPGRVNANIGGEPFHARAAIFPDLADSSTDLCGGGKRHEGGACRSRPMGTRDYNPWYAVPILGGSTMRAGIEVCR